MEIPNHYNIERIDQAFMEAINNLKSEYELIKEPKYKGIQSIGKDAIVVRLEATVDEKILYDSQRLMNRKIKIAFQNNGLENEQ